MLGGIGVGVGLAPGFRPLTWTVFKVADPVGGCRKVRSSRLQDASAIMQANVNAKLIRISAPSCLVMGLAAWELQNDSRFPEFPAAGAVIPLPIPGEMNRCLCERP